MLTRMLFIGGLLVLGCADDKGPTPPAEVGFVVSGTLSNDNQTQLPENLKVVVIWTAATETGEDYIYLFGEGAVDAENMTFEIVFAENPPSDALLADALGVGFILLTTDSDIEEGIVSEDDEDDLFQNALGAAGQHGVVFTTDKLDSLSLEEVGWLQQFPRGYSVGRGVKIPNSSFDGFEPVDPSSVEIIVDDMDDIELVNWT